MRPRHVVCSCYRGPVWNLARFRRFSCGLPNSIDWSACATATGLALARLSRSLARPSLFSLSSWPVYSLCAISPTFLFVWAALTVAPTWLARRRLLQGSVFSVTWVPFTYSLFCVMCSLSFVDEICAKHHKTALVMFC